MNKAQTLFGIKFPTPFFDEPDAPANPPVETPADPPADPPADEPASLISGAGQEEPKDDPASEGEDDPKDEKTPEDDDKSKDDKDSGEETPEITAESIVVPEGIELEPEALGAFVDLMNNQELTRPELAQKLVEMQIESANQLTDNLIKDWNDTQAKWQEEAKALPEIGGDNLDKTLAGIKTGFERLGAGEEFFAALNTTGAGNNPQIIQFLHKATQHLQEGAPLDSPTTPSSGPLSLGDRLYGKKE